MFCLNDFEEYARRHLDQKTWLFYSQGAEREDSLRENVSSFTRYHLVPRMLRNVQKREFSVTVLGEMLAIPFGIAPTAHQRLAHPDGEIAAAKAAAEMGSIYTLSTVANTALKDVAEAVAGATPLWMQVYVLNERKFTEQMVKKAEKCGFKALVVTVDTPVIGLQLRCRREMMRLPSHLSVPNVEDAIENTQVDVYNKSNFDSTMTWDDISWFKSISNLPIVLKGIMTAEDAVQAARAGASAVWVSNHGGRQLDSVQSAIDVLPGIKAALLGTDCEVYVDGGVRWGTDVMKAMALGADYVFIGRPALWGLAHSGQDGVRNVLEILKSELDRAMHLAGCKDMKDIGPHLVKRKDQSKI